MSLKVDFNICQSNDCSSISFVETTGAYNASTNSTGWGAPNPLTSNTTSAILTITLASGNIYNIDLLATTLFPSSDTTLEYIIPNTSFGNIIGTPISDQIINFTYTVIALGVTYTQNIQQAFYCQAQCCVMSMFADIDLDCDSCSDNKIDNALKAYALLKGMIYAANCGNTTNYNNILAQVNKICLNSNCSNCK